MEDMRDHARPRAMAALLSVAIVVAGCGGDPRRPATAAKPHAAARPPVTAERLAQAIRTNPNMPAEASCHRATAADRRAARTFANTRRLFVCRITLPSQRPAMFDVQVLGNGCFVAERRRRGQADYGCVRI
ncbi:MAG: hypothetical protein QOJ89_612 [bacterium]